MKIFNNISILNIINHYYHSQLTNNLFSSPYFDYNSTYFDVYGHTKVEDFENLLHRPIELEDLMEIDEFPHTQKISELFAQTFSIDDNSQLNREFERLRSEHEDLFNSGEIIQGSLDSVIDVDMDCVDVVSTKDHKYLSTSGLGPCIAICARGKKENGEWFLGLAHLDLLP